MSPKKQATPKGMKFTCTREALGAAISTVIKAAAERSTLPVLGNILIAALDSQIVRIAATNLELTIVTAITAQVKQVGAITLPARTFADYINTMPLDTVEIEANPKTQTATIKCAQFNGHIKGVDAEEFPIINLQPQSDRTFHVEPDVFKEKMKQVAVSVADNNMARPALEGVLFELNGNTLTVTSADGFRLTTSGMTIIAPKEKHTAKAIVPSKAIDNAVRLTKEQETPVGITFGDDTVTFHLERDTVTTKVIEANFPDYHQIVPKSNAVRTRVNVVELQRAIQASSVFARWSSNTILFDIQNQNWSDAHITVQATSAETGDNVAVVDATVDGDGHQFALNGRYVKDVLGTLNCPFVEILTETPETPVVLKQPSNNDYTHVIMPMSLKYWKSNTGSKDGAPGMEQDDETEGDEE